ncbi:transposase [Streptomyces nigrescens]|uniref:transposase n=1 Tax=Streptomyces nigrescens TaxID=1920 RepID=UPI003701AF98
MYEPGWRGGRRPPPGRRCVCGDDTGFPKDGRSSPGVARQYSGTLRPDIGLQACADAAVQRRPTVPRTRT